MILDVLAVICCAILNRIRGGGLGGDKLPGHARFWVAPVFGLVAGAHGLAYIPIVAVGYLFWAWLPWGRWYDLGRLPEGYPDTRPLSGFEQVVQKLPNDYLRFTFRNGWGLIPLNMINPFFILMAPIMTVLYEISWRVRPKEPISLAEYLTGALWGIFLVVLL